MTVTIREATPSDRTWIREILRERWGAPQIVTRGRIHEADTLPAWIAEDSGRRVGLLTCCIEGASCELVSLDALEPGRGIGGRLVEAIVEALRRRGGARLWLITTNDNVEALRFYQRRGFHLAALHCDAIARSRELKPSIPLIGNHGIPIRDELELERRLE
jgi:ribosomal protein S18 acetylase RimI-like enzyme